MALTGSVMKWQVGRLLSSRHQRVLISRRETPSQSNVPAAGRRAGDIDTAMGHRAAPGNLVNELFGGAVLYGKRALVTGARKGIGRGVALCLARAGCAAVGIVDIVDDEATQELVTLINASGSKGSLIIADLSTVAAIQHAVDTFAADGGIHILVNNAIIPHSPPRSTQSAPLLEMTEESWDGLVSVGLKGYFFACQRAAKHMVEQKSGGSLICMSSVHAVNPCANWTVYGSCKAALERMVKGLAVDLAEHGIRANAIAPGAIANDLPGPGSRGDLDGPVDPAWGLTLDGIGIRIGGESAAQAEKRGADFLAAVPSSCFGAPSDIGGAVIFLCSALGRYINGQTLRVDGGMSAANRLW